MEHFVTLFDSNYLPQGLALHLSMERHLNHYTLWIICVDSETFEVLSKMDLPNVRLLVLEGLETEALLKVKADRARGEYCWTLTPFAPRFVFDADPNVQRVTYLDADIWFVDNPEKIFSEFDASAKQVLITEHAYDSEYDQSEISGIYCVQFMTFTRQGGEIVRQWWEDRCVEWCYARVENGKFGDQKYLDDWPDRFSAQVHVLSCLEATQAPWNIRRFIDDPAIIYHFQGLRILDNNLVHLARYQLPAKALDTIYTPYLKDLRHAVYQLNEVGHTPRWQLNNTSKSIAYKLAQSANQAAYPVSCIPW